MLEVVARLSVAPLALSVVAARVRRARLTVAAPVAAAAGTPVAAAAGLLIRRLAAVVAAAAQAWSLLGAPPVKTSPAAA